VSGRPVTRRRVLRVIGAVACFPLAALAGAAGRAEPAAGLHRWRGVALGAPAEITLAHPDPGRARWLARHAVAEIRRLEAIFSLHRPDSELSRLNRDGRLSAPAHDLVVLASEARAWSERTAGSFDATVQPLWTLYTAHFARRPGDRHGPPRRALAQALRRVDYQGVEVSARAIRFARPGMAMTLNGIAQGYATDRVARLLRDAGVCDVLAHLGELRGLGRHPDGRPWRVALPEAAVAGEELPVVELADRALATSSGLGTRFEPSGRHHHLFDPASGRSARGWRSVSVLAPSATATDALATAIAVASPARAPALVATVPGAAALLTDAEGRTRRVGADWTPPGGGERRG
jgi:FAD:protein FMN transferase